MEEAAAAVAADKFAATDAEEAEGVDAEVETESVEADVELEDMVEAEAGVLESALESAPALPDLGAASCSSCTSCFDVFDLCGPNEGFESFKLVFSNPSARLLIEMVFLESVEFLGELALEDSCDVGGSDDGSDEPDDPNLNLFLNLSIKFELVAKAIGVGGWGCGWVAVCTV